MRKHVHYIHPMYAGITDNDVVRSHRRRRALRQATLIMVCLLGTSGMLAVGKFSSGGVDDIDHVAAEQIVAVAQPPKVIPQIDSVAMGNTIEQIVKQHPDMQIGVAITDLTTGTNYRYGVQDGFQGASTIKLISAALFLHKVEQGTYNMQTPVGGKSADEQLKLLIEESDNTAWEAFIKILQGRNIQKWTNDMGLASFNHNQNIIGVNDMAKFLAKLHKGELLNEANTKLLLGHMQQANRREFIMSAVPEGASAYHKAGWLTDRVHDAAIIDDGKRAYVLAIYTKANGTYDQAAGRALFQEITQATVKTFIAPKP